MKELPSLLLLVIAIVVSGCVSPNPLSNLNAVDGQSKFWHQGSEVVTQSQNGVTVEISYQRRTGESYIFDVAIYNESERLTVVDPNTFYYTPLIYSDTFPTVHAYNPEHQLLEIDKELSIIKAKEINQSIASALSATAEFTALVSSELTNQPEAEKEDLRNTIYKNQFYRNQKKSDIEYNKLSIEEQRAYWETQALRKTTLFPNQYITGEIFFNRNTEAKKVSLFLPIQNTVFHFEYHQNLVKAD